MLWTAEAVEDLKKLALEGKSASHISAALGVGSRNAVIGKASRIGIKLGGGGRGPGTRKGRRAGRPRWASAPYPRPGADDHGSDVARGSRSPGQAGGGEGGVDAWRSRDRRDATGEVRGDSRIRLSLAAGRSKKRGVRLLRAHAGRGPVLLRRPLPDGLSSAAARDRLRGSEGSAPSRVRGGFREAGARCLAPA